MRPMEGLRGFAVILVFLVHFVTLIKPWSSSSAPFNVFATALHTIGNAGVDLFFVLSGYLIYGSLISRRQQFMSFMSRRIERIYPTFCAVFTIYIILSYFFPAENKIPEAMGDGVVYLIKNFLLLPGIFHSEPMIAVAWSLSYEMFYYLTIPLLVTLFRLHERSSWWRTIFFLCVACAMVFYGVVTGEHLRLVMFVSGIVLFEAMNSHRVPTPNSVLGLLALACGLIGMLLPFEGSGGVVFRVCNLSIAFLILCLTCFRNPSAWLPRIFSWRPLRWLGNMSYSYYLLHGVTLKAGFLALSIVLPVEGYGSWLFFVLLPPMFILTLISSSVLFILVERPFSLSSQKVNIKPSGTSRGDSHGNARRI